MGGERERREREREREREEKRFRQKTTTTRKTAPYTPVVGVRTKEEGSNIRREDQKSFIHVLLRRGNKRIVAARRKGGGPQGVNNGTRAGGEKYDTHILVEAEASANQITPAAQLMFMRVDQCDAGSSVRIRGLKRSNRRSNKHQAPDVTEWER